MILMTFHYLAVYSTRSFDCRFVCSEFCFSTPTDGWSIWNGAFSSHQYNSKDITYHWWNQSMYFFFRSLTLVTREALDAVNGCDDLFSDDAPLLIEGGCAVGISFHVYSCLLPSSCRMSNHTTKIAFSSTPEFVGNYGLLQIRRLLIH